MTISTIVELAKLPLPSKLVSRIFSIETFHPSCITSPQLVTKYGVAEKNIQQVIAVRNRVTDDVTWFNSARKTKPQTFKAAAFGTDIAALDPTNGGGPQACDFCAWETLTAQDDFGRIEGPHCVTASNLFKYNAPSQGVVLFKNLHDPLGFSLPHVQDLLSVSAGWFDAAANHAIALEEQKKNIDNTIASNTDAKDSHSEHKALHPLFVWNALPRAGASQFHGHAQIMLSAVPMPSQQREARAVALYSAENNGASYYHDVYAAHEALGLGRKWGGNEMEQKDTALNSQGIQPAIEAVTATAYASLCPSKDAEIVVHGSSLRCPAFQTMVYAALRALIDELGVCSFNAGIYNIPLLQELLSVEQQDSKMLDNLMVPGAPVVARVVSRGKLTSAASDFGGLEVFAGASIGHTDPFQVVAALDASLQKL